MVCADYRTARRHVLQSGDALAQLLACVAKPATDGADRNLQDASNLGPLELIPVEVLQQLPHLVRELAERLAHDPRFVLGLDRAKRAVRLLAVDRQRREPAVQRSRSLVLAIAILQLVLGDAEQPSAKALGTLEGVEREEAGQHRLLREILDGISGADLASKEPLQDLTVTLEQLRLSTLVARAYAPDQLAVGGKAGDLL